MIGVRLYLAQRISALVMAPLVIGHLAVMIYAVQNGLTASEILSRTQGSLWWGTFYALFVVAVAIHAAIGVRVIMHETFQFPTSWLNPLTWGIGLFLVLLGGRAIAAVVL